MGSEEKGCGLMVLCVIVIATTAMTFRGCDTKIVVDSQPQVREPAEAAPEEARPRPARWEQAKGRLPDFSIGTVAFWSLVAIEVLVLIALTEFEQGAFGLVSIALFIALVQWLGRSDPLGWAYRHPGRLLMGAAGYYAIGVGWGFAKWFLFIQDRKHLYEEAKAGWLLKRGVCGTSTVPIADRPAWRGHLEKNSDVRVLSERPLARKNKNRIVNWISFWPVSMLWSFLADFVKGVAKAIYYQLAGWFQSVSDSQWKGIDDELGNTDAAKTVTPEL